MGPPTSKAASASETASQSSHSEGADDTTDEAAPQNRPHEPLCQWNDVKRGINPTTTDTHPTLVATFTSQNPLTKPLGLGLGEKLRAHDGPDGHDEERQHKDVQDCGQGPDNTVDDALSEGGVQGLFRESDGDLQRGARRWGTKVGCGKEVRVKGKWIGYDWRHG